MSALHHDAFHDDRPWSAQEFADLLASPHVNAQSARHGFALFRTVARESELLTLAVDPAHQRRGIASTLVKSWLAGLAGYADSAFLEVAADNHPARALYVAFGFETLAIRPAYYSRTTGPAVDAMVLSRGVTGGQQPESAPQRPESG